MPAPTISGPVDQERRSGTPIRDADQGRWSRPGSTRTRWSGFFLRPSRPASPSSPSRPHLPPSPSSRPSRPSPTAAPPGHWRRRRPLRPGRRGRGPRGRSAPPWLASAPARAWMSLACSARSSWARAGVSEDRGGREGGRDGRFAHETFLLLRPVHASGGGMHGRPDTRGRREARPVGHCRGRALPRRGGADPVRAEARLECSCSPAKAGATESAPFPRSCRCCPSDQPAAPAFRFHRNGSRTLGTTARVERGSPGFPIIRRWIR